ncbi:MAG: MarR family transcriptional regulator [Veillonella sp.]|uniref:MarR family winged helix-turn-helix transcriptional regulator n=1 Tax=Veillonella sp. TaxID=1926307 RepID=UPI0025D859DF|nr:MarR family transcriptional regulator [Veillonella sp.]MBS4912987.1 MarR family transcriptional regulator [Veillonella sp.]
MKNTKLTEKEFNIWTEWKRTCDDVFALVINETLPLTGLSAGDFGVLDRLIKEKSHKMRQIELSDSMGWSKSRLSHHLTRMEKRNLITREPILGGIMIVLTEEGKTQITNAQPIMADAIKKYFLDYLTEDDYKAIERLADILPKFDFRK